MRIETIEKMFNFLKEKEGRELPKKWVERLKLIKELETHPDDLQYRYNGNLSLFRSNITKLPNDLFVNGFLSLINCKEIRNLPDKLHVEGNLSIPDTNISELPNKLYVGRNFSIANTPLAEKYTDEEIRKIVASTGGQINGQILK